MELGTKDKSKYIEAAEMIADGTDSFSCHALELVEFGRFNTFDRPRYNTRLFQAYKAVFKPKEYGETDAWFGYTDDPQNQLARSLALLFMAEMTEEKKKRVKK